MNHCANLLITVCQELIDLGFKTDADIRGADVVEYLGALLPDIEEALERDGIGGFDDTKVGTL